MANIFTDAGEAFIAGLVAGDYPRPDSYYVGWGTGVGVSAKEDTTLFSESVEETRQAVSESKPDVNTNRFIGRITVQTSDKTITNAGLFIVDAGGEPILKSDFNGVPLNIGDSAEFTFDLVWS